MARVDWLGLSSILVFLCSPALAQRPAGDKLTPLGVLTRKIKAEAEVKLSGVRKVAWSRDGQSIELQQRVLRDSSGRYRLEAMSDTGGRSTTIICDGRTLWRFDPRRHAVTQQDVSWRAEPLAERLNQIQDLDKRFHLELGDGGRVAGRRTWLVTIGAVSSKTPLYRYWVDRDTSVELKNERYSDTGETIQSEGFLTIDYAPTLTGAEFTWQPQTGIQVHVRERPPAPLELSLERAREAVGFDIFVPPASVLPYGFTLMQDKVGVLEHRGAKVACLRFSNIIDLFSLFERRSPTGLAAGRRRRVPSAWTAGQLHFTLVGRSLRPEDIQRIKGATVQALGPPGHHPGPHR